jgi:hypothetical protein
VENVAVYARVATFEGIELTPEEVQTIVDELRERIAPALQELPGWRGGAQLRSLDGGRVVVVQLFDTLEHLEAAEPLFESGLGLLDEGPAAKLAGKRTSVERFWLAAGMLEGAQFWASSPRR